MGLPVVQFFKACLGMLSSFFESMNNLENLLVEYPVISARILMRTRHYTAKISISCDLCVGYMCYAIDKTNESALEVLIKLKLRISCENMQGQSCHYFFGILRQERHLIGSDIRQIWGQHISVLSIITAVRTVLRIKKSSL